MAGAGWNGGRDGGGCFLLLKPVEKFWGSQKRLFVLPTLSIPQGSKYTSDIFFGA